MKKVKIIKSNFQLHKGNKITIVGEEVEINNDLAKDLIQKGFAEEVKKPTKQKEEDE